MRSPSSRTHGVHSIVLRMAENVWIPIIAIAVVAFAWWAIGTRSQDHHVRASFNSAALVVPGLDVRVDGLIVGKTGTIEYRNGHALVRLGISDEDHWPLRQGTRAVIRFGTTIGNGTRYVELEPGPSDAPQLAEDGLIPEARTTSAVEFDEIFNAVDKRTRGNVRRMLKGTADSLTGNERAVREGLRRLPNAAGATSDLLDDLAADSAALDGLVVNTERVSRTLAARTPAVADLVTVASATFSRLAANADALQATLDRLPNTLQRTRTTLARLDRTVAADLTPVVDALRPGADRLPAVASSAAATLAEVRRVTPAALSTISSLRGAAPELTNLSSRGAPLLRKAAHVASELAPMMACIRPYAPEAGGFFVGWGGWVKNYTINRHPDTNKSGSFSSHYARVRALAGPASVHNYPAGLPISEILSRATGMRYAFPMPPGYLADRPMFNERCGYGPDSLDPAKDPENGTP